MITMETAKKIGHDACLEKLGREFVSTVKGIVCSGYCEDEDSVFCYMGVHLDSQRTLTPGTLRLSTGEPPAYRASCDVSLRDGNIKFLECVLP